jgi:hypothetical protein
MIAATSIFNVLFTHLRCMINVNLMSYTIRCGQDRAVLNEPDGDTLMSLSLFRAGGVALALTLLAACSRPDPLNTAGRPDGTAGNPTGTATSRAFDRAAGTDVSGAYPSQADGTRANPPGTAVSRALGTTNR